MCAHLIKPEQRTYRGLGLSVRPPRLRPGRFAGSPAPEDLEASGQAQSKVINFMAVDFAFRKIAAKTSFRLQT